MKRARDGVSANLGLESERRLGMDAIVELKSPVQLRDPLVVSGFAVRRRAGRLASGALSYLIAAWNGELYAKIGPDDFYDLAILRPQIRWPGDKSVLDWPETMFYVAQPPGGRRDVVFVIGNEPHYHWQGFAGIVSDYLQKWAAHTLVTARAFPASVPHTRPAPICLSSKDRALMAEYKASHSDWKIEGEADISVLLAQQAETLGWQTLDLSVLQPSYFPRMPNAQARLSLIDSIAHAVGSDVDLASLREAAEVQAKAVDEAFATTEGMPDLIRQLERQYDAGVDRPGLGEPAGATELPV